MATKKKATKKTTKKAPVEQLVIVAGDSGVYVGLLAGGAASVDGGGSATCTVHLRNARHLRRYYVAGRTGDGSASDLAVRGLDPKDSSVSDPVIGVSTLVGVRRVFDVGADAAASLGVPS